MIPLMIGRPFPPRWFRERCASALSLVAVAILMNVLAAPVNAATITVTSALEGTLEFGDAFQWRDADRDFNGAWRSGTYRGAYSGDGNNPGWLPDLDFKPEPAIYSDGFESGDTTHWILTIP